jgi:hypothetical protein
VVAQDIVAVTSTCVAETAVLDVLLLVDLVLGAGALEGHGVFRGGRSDCACRGKDGDRDRKEESEAHLRPFISR